MDPMFPKLDDGQIERLGAFGERRHAQAGEVIVDQGDSHHGVFVVLDGSVELLNSSQGDGPVIHLFGRGEFTGEVNMLSGRRSLIRLRARDASTVLEIDRVHLRQIMQMDVALGETFLNAFIQRRVYLIAHSVGDAVLIGSAHSSDTLRLREFLTRNGHPHTYLDVETDPSVPGLLGQFGIPATEIPVLICRGESALRNPTNAQAAACFGLNDEIDQSEVCDLIVVGAGPSGLAAAVYGASEGLNVLVIERNAPGGQAGSSSRIENYLGFPLGISGQELAGRAFVQAEKFGARISIARSATQLTTARAPYTLALDDGKSVRGRSVIMAAGSRYRRLDLPNLAQFEGVGIYYGATRVEAGFCGDQEITVVGGGNSAGQAALFLSAIARHVYLLVRGPGLASTMSQYLISRIEGSAQITLMTWTQIDALEGGEHLDRIHWRNTQSGARGTLQTPHVFVMTGADPNSEWLDGKMELDAKGFIKTGTDVGPAWPLRRSPYLLESSLPGVFAVGDIRAGSVKRVASAVGEGSMAVQMVHKFLAE
jgi:thioredoxin reductase (NADPH)